MGNIASRLAASTLRVMRLHHRIVVCVLILAASAFAQPSTAPTDSKWNLIWSDEFAGPSLDRTKWGFDLGNGFKSDAGWIGGWGNDEREYYTDRPENAYVSDGMLHIRAVREDFQGCNFTSARLVTRGLFNKAYGRFEFRAKLPTGKGMW